MSHSARVEKYRRLIEEAESWLFSHDDAMACLDLEDHVANLVFVFERLNKLDQDSRMALFGGKVPCVPQADEAVRMCYVGWQKAAEICRLEVVRMQDKGYPVERADQLRDSMEEVRGILTPDSEFFTNDKLWELRDKAVNDHRQGLSELLEG